MSGTSADGIDVALCRISPRSTDPARPRVELLAHNAHPYNTETRTAVLAAMGEAPTSTADLALLHWQLGALYADAVIMLSIDADLTPDLIALHGQTVYHQSAAEPFLGGSVRATWQLGEPSVLAEHFRVPIVSDFRPADLAAGGQGAPLVPMYDFVQYRHATRNRLLLNLGGIANMTALPAGCDTAGILAFDTGPANMVIDALMQQLLDERFDRNGLTAAHGTVIEPALLTAFEHPYFTFHPPKSCGREQFGELFVYRFQKWCRRHSKQPADIVATATALTAHSVLQAYSLFAWPHLAQRAPQARGTDLFVAGGGAANRTLMAQLMDGFKQFGIRLQTTEATGIPIAAKEAVAFALLGWLTYHGLPGNVPSATGASRPVVLGKLTHA